MNLILLEESERKTETLFSLKNRKKEHILSILKGKRGDQFQAGILNQGFGTIQILEITQDSIIVTFQENDYANPFTPEIELFSAFQRPQTTKKILQLAGCTGIRAIHFFPFEKSERSYQTSSLWKDEAWKGELILGLEQGKRIQLPLVHLNFDYKERMEFHFPENLFLLDLEGVSIREIPIPGKASRIGLILGPESGLTPKDRAFFIAKGAKPIRLSHNILRSEFALAFALSQLELVMGL